MILVSEAALARFNKKTADAVEVLACAQACAPLGKVRVGEMEQLSASKPPKCREGRNPIPMCLVNGAWIWGDKQHEDADISACVVYPTQPSPETGHMGWVWWVLGRMGDANTLKDAMAQAEAKLAQITAAEQAHGR